MAVPPVPPVHTTGINWQAAITTISASIVMVSSVVGFIMHRLTRFIGAQIQEKIAPIFSDMQQRLARIEGRLGIDPDKPKSL